MITTTRPEPTGAANGLRRLRDACHPQRASTLGAVIAFLIAGVVSVAFLLRAAGTADVPRALLLLGGGAASGAIGLLFINEPISEWAHRRRHAAAFLGLAMMVLGALVVRHGFGAESGARAAVGMIILMLGSLPVGHWHRTSHLPWPGLVLVIGLAVGAAGGVALGQFTVGEIDLAAWSGHNRWVAAIVAFAGVVLVKVGVAQWIDLPLKRDPEDTSGWHRARAKMMVWIGFWVALAGIAGMTLAGRSEHLPLFSLAVGATLVGLTVHALAGQRHVSSPLRWLLLAIVGVALVVWGGVRATSLIGEWRWMIAVTIAVLIAVGVWFVYRGEGMFVLVLAGFVFAWVLHDRTVEVPPVPDDGPLILAVGDSYIAGQGDHVFYEGSNTRQRQEGNPCRRSPNTYPELVGAQLEMGVINMACSGAHTSNILQWSQHLGSAGYGSMPQLLHIKDLAPDVKARIEVVLVSAGGNDVGFGTIIPACLLPTDCSESAPFWLERARTVEAPLTEVYVALAAELPRAEIVAMPYPQLLDGEACGLAIGENERPFIITFQKALNSAIVGAVEGARARGVAVTAFPGSFDALVRSNRLLCDEGRQGVNFIHLLPHEGSAGDRLNPYHWKDGSLHPRQEGHAELAAVLQPWLAAGLGGGFEVGELDHASLDLTPDEEAITVPETEAEAAEVAVAGDVAEGLRREQEAIATQLWATVTSVSLAASALVLGGLFLALVSVQLFPRWRAIAAPDRPLPDEVRR